MKKIVIVIIIVIIILMGSILLGKKLYSNYTTKQLNQENIDRNEINTEINKESTNIKERGELNTRGLFELSDGVSSYEINLMANDMNWDVKTSLYYKIITNEDDYNRYKARITLPEMNNFEKEFLIIVANENIRSEDENDLIISEVISDDTTIQIIMKQKENPSAYSINNVFYAVVENIDLKENIEIKIEH